MVGRSVELSILCMTRSSEQVGPGIVLTIASIILSSKLAKAETLEKFMVT